MFLRPSQYSQESQAENTGMALPEHEYLNPTSDLELFDHHFSTYCALNSRLFNRKGVHLTLASFLPMFGGTVP